MIEVKKLNFENLETLSSCNCCIVKVDDTFFAKKLTLSTILTFFINYKIKHLSCGNECNLDKVLNETCHNNLHDRKAHLVGFELGFLMLAI